VYPKLELVLVKDGFYKCVQSNSLCLNSRYNFLLGHKLVWRLFLKIKFEALMISVEISDSCSNCEIGQPDVPRLE
jgi:hypothetical protein